MERKELLERYLALYPLLRRQALLRLGNRQDAEDALQNAFLRAWVHCRSLRRAESFPGWMQRIVQRETVNILRRRRAWLPLEELALAPRFEEERWISRIDLQRAFLGLSGLTGECFRLRYGQGMSIREIACLTKLSESAVRARLHSARRSIRRAELMRRSHP